MAWWKEALYDTCSLITRDKLLLERAALARHFPKSILALEESFSADQLRKETAGRMKRLAARPAFGNRVGGCSPECRGWMTLPACCGDSMPRRCRT